MILTILLILLVVVIGLVWLQYRTYRGAGETLNTSLYTFTMTDPDAPSAQNPTSADWLHWLVINATNPDDASSGQTIASYEGPSPPAGSGPHRYYTRVWKQADRLVVNTPPRERFPLAAFAAEHGLTMIKETHVVQNG
jgi:phosphatidylethanolamine-binding protein (PEBP) family uncharacterized protein